MSWNALSAELDSVAFAHLSDDPSAIWSRNGAQVGVVSIILEQVERPSRQGGMAMIEMADVARFSVAQAAEVAPGMEPQSGDVLTVSERARVIHGQPWRDDRMDRRDWLCPVID